VRILYLGLPLGAVVLDRAGFRPATVALGHPKSPGSRRVRRRLGARGTLVLGAPDLSDRGVVEVLAAARPDALLSWFWPRRIPAEVLALPPRGAFGVHPSLLPRHRGPDPYFWALHAGDVGTGVTLHRLEADYDVGAIVERRRVAVREDDDAWSLARRLDRPSLALLVSCARRLANGEPLLGRAQDEAMATLAPRPTPDDLAIDWRRPAHEIVALVRAAAPLGATARMGDHDVDVIAARVYTGALPKALAVAEALAVDEGLAVRAGDGAVLVTRVRLADETIVSTRALHRLV
jgi:methionyl-tRNA formyltransferase